MGNTFVSDLGGWRNKMTKLLFDGRKSWAKAVVEAAKNEVRFEEVKKTSPFANKTVVTVSYDNGGTSFYGDIFTFADVNGGIDIASSIVKTAIRAKGWAVHDADDYLLVFNKTKSEGTGDVEIFWIGSRKTGAKSPESARRQ